MTGMSVVVSNLFPVIFVLIVLIILNFRRSNPTKSSVLNYPSVPDLLHEIPRVHSTIPDTEFFLKQTHDLFHLFSFAFS